VSVDQQENLVISIAVGIFVIAWWIWFTVMVATIRVEAAKITAELRKQTNIAQASFDAEEKERAAANFRRKAKARSQRSMDREEDEP
jgi:hypothetical protein